MSRLVLMILALFLMVVPLRLSDGSTAGMRGGRDPRQFLPRDLKERRLEVMMLPSSEMLTYVAWPDGGNVLICEGIPGNASEAINTLKKHIIGHDTFRKAAASMGWKPRIDRLLLTRLHRINVVGLSQFPKKIALWELWVPAPAVWFAREPYSSPGLERIRQVLSPWLKKARPLLIQSLYDDRMLIPQVLSEEPLVLKVAKLADRPEEAAVWIRFGDWRFLISPIPGVERVFEDSEIILGSQAESLGDVMNFSLALKPGRFAWFVTDGVTCYMYNSSYKPVSASGESMWLVVNH